MKPNTNVHSQLLKNVVQELLVNKAKIGPQTRAQLDKILDQSLEAIKEDEKALQDLLILVQS